MKKRFSLIKISKADAENCSQLFCPKYESDIEISKKLPLGQEVAGSCTDGDLRNSKFNRKYHALLKFAFFHMPEKYSEDHIAENEEVIRGIKSVEDLRQEILMQIGCREHKISLSGREYYTTKSMKFDKMGAEEFEKVYSDTFDFISKYILPGVSNKDVQEQLMSFM